MKRATRQRLPLILTSVVVAIAVAAIAVSFAVENVVQTTTPTPTPTLTAAGGSEIPESTGTPTPPQLGIETTPLISGPLPESASATGELVAGFPTSVISLPPGAEVISSAIATEGERMQVTVVATSAAPEEEVQSYFEGVFSDLGMTGAETPAASGSKAVTWSRGTDSIVVATTPDAGETRLSVFALFTAGTS